MDEITAYRNECAQENRVRKNSSLSKTRQVYASVVWKASIRVNGKKIPIYIADYVMMGYGTGATGSTWAHDQRDYDFAKKFGIDIIQVIKGGDISKEATQVTVNGQLRIPEWLYKEKKDSIERMLEELEKKGMVKPVFSTR